MGENKVLWGLKVIYVNRQQLNQLLEDPMFVAYAPNFGKISGGLYNDTNVFFQLKKSVK